MAVGSREFVEGGASPSIGAGARVSASLPLGYRATLVERGSWEVVSAVLEARDPHTAALLDDLRSTEWVSLRVHVSLVEAAGAALGLEAVRELGFARTQANTMGGLFPNLLRSWVRSFRSNPASLFGIGPQIWQVGFRDAGELLLRDQHADRARVQIVDCRLLAGSPAWQQAIEGAAAGILRLAGLEERVTSRSDGVSTTDFWAEWGTPSDG